MARPSHRRTPTRTISRFVGTLILIVALWAVGLFRYADEIPVTVTDPDVRTDAIVVLTGGSGRLDEGLR